MGGGAGRRATALARARLEHEPGAGARGGARRGAHARVRRRRAAHVQAVAGLGGLGLPAESCKRGGAECVVVMGVLQHTKERVCAPEPNNSFLPLGIAREHYFDRFSLYIVM